MSASLTRCCQRAVPNLLSPLNVSGLPLVQIRTAKRVKVGTGRGTMDTGRARRRNRGIKVQDGTFVHQGQVLVKQTGLRFYPGENVDISRNYTMSAMCDGKVIVSCERLNPKPDSPLYAPVQKGVIIYKKFFNVYPIRLHGKFRLVDQV
ncbi:large ribosomal subunit protein bL27m-like [Ylistrum balloti]|uniref:large ribosomal subunit protein bL27m-like n=1 Tax=Ylistrum balloti TaxID=509963 RepID=UPI002905953E|nr:large ribosomal subunit protein bL27m-like [Ylistrum balloti]